MSPEQRAKTICTILEADTCAHLEGDDWATLERLVVEEIREAEDAAYERAATVIDYRTLTHLPPDSRLLAIAARSIRSLKSQEP